MLGIKQACHISTRVACSWNGNGTPVLRFSERNGNAPPLVFSVRNVSVTSGEIVFLTECRKLLRWEAKNGFLNR